MQDDEKNWRDYLAIVQRRIWYILGPFVLVFAGSVAVALLLPAVYRSSATILIEEPDIPRELAVSTISTDANRRMETINRRVMTTENLTEIIRAHDLFPDQQQELPLPEVADMMHRNITFELATVREGGAAIAFVIAFDYGSPHIAQTITNELVSLYLDENERDRQFRATQTTSFFEGETKRLEGVIAGLESELAELRRTRFSSLPEQLEFNQKLIARAEEELRDIDRREQTLEEGRVYLQSELAQIDPYFKTSNDEERALRPEEQLKVLRNKLTIASSRYGLNHPDVIRMQREMKALGQEVGVGPDATSLRLDLARTEAELATARQRYSESHPEVIGLSRKAAALRDSLAKAGRGSPSGRSVGRPNNPAYIQLQAQLKTTDLELNALADQRKDVLKRISEYEKRVEDTPSVQQVYQSLTRALEGATTEYREVRAKQMAAQMGELLETERKAERLSLLEPADLPSKPYKPNRLKILLIGFVLSLGCGIGLAFLLEMINDAVYGASELAGIVGAPPLAVIPYIRTKAEVVHAWRLRAACGLALVTLIGGAITYVHLYVVPLDEVVTKIERRLDTTRLSGAI